jgi:hypothetical protein
MPRDYDVAGSIGRECQPVNLLAVRATEERRPLEPGIDYERQRVRAIRHIEPVTLSVDLAKAALETTRGSVGQFFPGYGRGLTKRSGSSLEDQSSVGGNLQSRDPDCTDDDLLEISVRTQKHVVIQPTIPLQDAHIDAVVESAIPHPAKRGNIRLPAPPVVAEKKVVDAAPLLLAGEGRGRRGSLEQEAHVRGSFAPHPQRDATWFQGCGEIASEPRGEERRPVPLTTVLDEIKPLSRQQAQRGARRGRHPLPFGG